MSKTNQLRIELPANGDYSNLRTIQDGLLKAINLLSLHNDADPKRVFASVNGISTLLSSINTTRGKSPIVVEHHDNAELKDWMYIWLLDAIEIISSKTLLDAPDECKAALGSISTILKGMNPYEQTIRLAS